jgi:hypothetical protein
LFTAALPRIRAMAGANLRADSDLMDDDDDESDELMEHLDRLASRVTRLGEFSPQLRAIVVFVQLF